MALLLYIRQDPGRAPVALQYLVHYGLFPQPRGAKPQSVLLPPRALLLEDAGWMRLDLSPGVTRTKMEALQAYATQVKLLGNFLPSFARRDEIFALDSPEWMSVVDTAEMHSQVGHEADAHSRSIRAERARSFLLAGTDLVGIRCARVASRVWITVEARGAMLPGVGYHILVKTPDGLTHDYRLSSLEPLAGSWRVTSLDLEDLGEPSVLGFRAEARVAGHVLDRAGWFFVLMEE